MYLAQTTNMRLKLKSHWMVFTLLLTVNIGLISAILLLHSKQKKAGNACECSESKKSFNANALNSITIKLM